MYKRAQGNCDFLIGIVGCPPSDCASGYEPSTLSLIWRNLTPFWAEKALPIGPNFGPKKPRTDLREVQTRDYSCSWMRSLTAFGVGARHRRAGVNCKAHLILRLPGADFHGRLLDVALVLGLQDRRSKAEDCGSHGAGLSTLMAGRYEKPQSQRRANTLSLQKPSCEK